jgi:chaperonin GroEL
VQYQKVKSVAKSMRSKGKGLNDLVLKTMGIIADMVGSTLGPGGSAVLIERQEFNLPPMVTKDGVTVFRNLGFEDATAHVLMEAARDAAVRTANEAGDGTTTATVLADAIVRKTYEFCANNPKVSPQKVVRRLQAVFKDTIEPLIRRLSRTMDPSSEDGRQLLWNVAKISANGDTDLADAVLHCYDLVGDDGNVTITEISGPSSYEVERIEGYPIPMGWEDCCAKYGTKFLTDPANQRVVLENPLFVVYHGRITEIQSLVKLMESIGTAWQSNEGFRHNVVLVATGFSDSVLAQLALNFADATTINVFPLLAPLSPVPNGQYGILEDICAVTGATMFDPLNKPFDSFSEDFSDLGQLAVTFEAGRFRSVIMSESGETTNAQLLIAEQVEKLQAQMKQSASQLDEQFFQERIGKLTGGIAKLKVVGASNGELRERRDRAEDAVCAVRGAIRHGCLPGGGWTLLRVANDLLKLEDEIVSGVLCPALIEPVVRLLKNCGFSVEESKTIQEEICKPIVNGTHTMVYDALEHRMVDPWEGGVLDSTPAVLEAIRNSLSIATLLGTLGGTVVYKRDNELERSEARATNSFLRDADYAANPADERAL